MAFKDELQRQTSTASFIVNFLTNTKKIGQENLTAETLQTRLSLLESYWAKFLDRHDLLVIADDFPTTDYAKRDFFVQTETAYTLAKSYLLKLMKENSASEMNISTNSTSKAATKLPKSRLPTFAGDYLQWESFRDLFTSMIHNVTDLSDAERLQYLKTSLTGEAARVISNVKITDANYKGAWKALEERYDNKRLLLYHHFHSLMSIKPMITDSAATLRTLLDSTKETRTSLENMGRPVFEWDDWFVYLTVQKLDATLKRDWENSLGNGKHIPTFQELEQFLSNRLQAMEITAPSKGRGLKTHHSKTETSSTSSCELCKLNHYLGRCIEFRRKSVRQRKELVNQWQVCHNCLKRHSSTSCSSAHRCFRCGAAHHTLLHEDKDVTTPAPPKSLHSAHAQSDSWNNRPTLLATAVVNVSGSNGRTALVRALLDQGSEATFISEDLVQRLLLPRTKANVPVTGMGETKCCMARGIVQIRLSSAEENESSLLTTQAFVLPRLTKIFRPTESALRSWPHLRHLKLSGAGFCLPSRIDLVIGADLYGHVLLDGLIKGSPNAPVAQRTIFGWVLSGRLNKPSAIAEESSVTTFHCSIDQSLSRDLQKFWEIEEPVQHSLLTPEEENCEEHFRRTHSRAPDGRFIVRLPKRPDVTLGFSRSIALQAFIRSEKRRQCNKELNQAYNTFLQEYLDLGHMAPTTATPTTNCNYYLPHHAVWKREGQLQKIRVVFNASSKTSSGSSLNDLLLPGPKLQQDIGDVVTRWRTTAVAFTADIVKMFRQIWVHPDDQGLQRILWREDSHQELQEFKLKTVTYGTACAPYLAIRCLHQLATDEATRFPEAAKILRTQVYVDDILAGADSLEGAVQLKEDLQSLLMAGGFQLAKWASNSPGLAETGEESQLLSDGSVKTLGLRWHPESDTFGFKVTLEDVSQLTKRVVLSCTAKLFDPLGWLAPVLVRAKIFLQNLWTVRSDWDDALPNAMETSWIKFYNSLIHLQEVKIQRWISLQSTYSWEIHGFCDASTRAYAAAVYIRILHPNGSFISNLLMAKTKVAPIKVLSLPRLELCGAVLLAKLLRRTVELFPGTVKMYAWTDSQVVLCWLREHPSRWKCFVANRTSEIHQIIPDAIWNHVRSGDNPADPASRGINAEHLPSLDLWWHGPDWLSEPKSRWPSSPPIHSHADVQAEENPQVLSLATQCQEAFTLQDRFSSLLRLLRVTAWILRFGSNSRTEPKNRIFGPLKANELSVARKAWIRFCQWDSYATEILSLKRNDSIANGSSLLSLRPFLDSEGLLRVGGRLEHSTLEYEEKHPYILPSKCHFSRLLVLDAHHRVLHGGPQLTFSLISRHYWIVHGRRLVRNLIRACVRCTRYNAKVKPPLMGQLPADRVTPSRPFLHTGLDYAGPIRLRTTKGRGYKAYKGYIALFVCLSTKAVHLEAVSDYTADGFIASFKRFCSRRGIPTTISSDQATNFRGADTQLQRLLQTASAENQRIAELLANDGVQWQFIPPHAPHFGGLWEAGVRSVKNHLRRTIGDRTLTFEELTTVLTEIEACLNSRPLTPLSASPQDITALTPGHFLIGSALKAIPEPSLREVHEPRLNRWQLLRRLTEQFWHRWKREYLQQLQQRSKWKTKSENLQVNDLVLVAEDNLPPTKWCLGRITQLHPGPDGIVRVVTIRTATTELQRPVVKLCRLPDDH